MDRTMNVRIGMAMSMTKANEVSLLRTINTDVTESLR